MQLLPSLLSELQAVCATFPDRRKGRGGNIAPTDFGLSAFAMFFMQSASFLAYQRTMEKGHGRSNCRTLFGIGRIPSDNYIRDMLDEADPALLQPCFERMETLLAEPAMRRARPEAPGDDAGGSQSARLRLAHRVGTAGAALAGRARSRRQANQLLRPHPHADRLRRLSLRGATGMIPDILNRDDC